MHISTAFELTDNTCALLLVGVGFTFGMVGPLPPLNPPLVGHVQQSVRTRYLEVVWPKSQASPVFCSSVSVLRFSFSIIHGSGRARKTGKTWEHLSRE